MSFLLGAKSDQNQLNPKLPLLKGHCGSLMPSASQYILKNIGYILVET